MKITIYDLRNTGRKSPWCVSYYSSGAAKKRYFPTYRDALVYRDELIAQFRSGADPTDEDRVNRLVAGTGFTKLALVTIALDYLSSSRPTSMTAAGPVSEGSTNDCQPHAEHRAGGMNS